MNDPMVDLTAVINAHTSQEMHAAWQKLKESYYNLKAAKERANVRMVDSPSGLFYETIRGVPPGDELARMYGFSTWTFELLEILTIQNVGGFAQFVVELAGDLQGDP